MINSIIIYQYNNSTLYLVQSCFKILYGSKETYYILENDLSLWKFGSLFLC